MASLTVPQPAGANPVLLPVLAPLDGLLPWGGLRVGSTVVVDSPALVVALLAGPSGAGSWCAAVGLPSLGLAAAAAAGVVLERLAVVARPGRQWLAVTAVLLDAFDVVVVHPQERLRPVDARRLVARARQRGAVLIAVSDRHEPVAGADGVTRSMWEGAEARLAVTASRWEGLGQGDGHLRGRLATVRADGRGAVTRPRTAALWLPASDGRVRPVTDQSTATWVDQCASAHSSSHVGLLRVAP